MEKKEIKIVGLDLDGTLLTDKKELLPYTKNVIGEALQNGTVVLVATGRPWTGVPEELRELPGMDYALTANGARIIETRTGKVLEEHLLSKEAAKKAIAIGRKYDTLLEVYFDGQGYAQKDEIAQVRKYHKNPNMWDYFLRTRIAVDRLEDLLDEKGKMTELIDQVKDYIADHLDEELKRTDLAAMIYLHPDYLSHVFKDETGMSLSEYITRKRIDYAMMLLEKTNRSVSDIAAKCGYASLAYFTKTFKRIIGMSPKEYRKVQKEKKR